jgi:hypothetical protein
MKNLLLASLLISSTAFAGKAEREFLSEKAEPAVKAAGESFHKNCGCPLKITPKWDAFKNIEQMGSAVRTLNSITEESASYCKDAGSKKAMCAMKSLELSVSKDATINFAGGKMSITTNSLGDTTMGWDQITRTVDK